MLRDQLGAALKTAMKAHDQRAVSAVRMILAKLKERDIESRGAGKGEQIADADIVQMLQGMVKQRRESIELYRKGNRPELAAQEEGEIAVIESFMPKQLSEAEIDAAVAAAIAETGAQTAKDMGRVMAVLKERHQGQMDFSKASQAAKKRLG